MAKKKQEFLKVMSPKFRLAFPNLFTPQDGKKESDPKRYGMTMLFDKNVDLSKLEKACVKQCEAFFGKEKFAKLRKNPNFKWPFRDGNVERDEYNGFENTIFITASARADKHKPGIVDRDREDIIDPSEIYSGCYCRATLSVYAYDNESNGVSFGVVNVQKLADGEPLGTAKASAADDFEDDFEDDDDDL